MQRPLLLTAGLCFFSSPVVPAQQHFTELVSMSPAAPYGFGLVVADLDRDGDVDIATGPWSFFMPGAAMRVFLNDDGGALTELAAAGPPARLFTFDMTAGDVDGDGFEDIVLVNLDRQMQLYLNNGDATFRDRSQELLGPLVGYRAGVLGDFDGDGAPDLMIAGEPTEPPLIKLNDGRGSFRQRSIPLPPVPSPARRVRAADLDQDGDLDAVIAAVGADVLLINDGTGVMTASPGFPAPAFTPDVQFGDVDGDGDLDAVAAQLVATASEVRVLLNDGAASFVDRGAGSVVPDPISVNSLALGDVDNDGDVDLAVGTHDDSPTLLYLNDGSGRFALDASRTPGGDFDATPHIAFADLDGDHDLDLVLGNQWTGSTRNRSRTYTNLLRQSHAPAPPRVGSRYVIDLFSRPGFGTAPTLVVAMLGPTRARTSLGALGVLRLAPAGLVAPGIVLVPAPSGRGQLELRVPPDPRLVGTPVLSQSLFVPVAGPARLGNLVTGRVQPARDG